MIVCVCVCPNLFQELDYNTYALKNLLELQNHSSVMLLTRFVNRWQMNITAEF